MKVKVLADTKYTKANRLERSCISSIVDEYMLAYAFYSVVTDDDRYMMSNIVVTLFILFDVKKAESAQHCTCHSYLAPKQIGGGVISEFQSARCFQVGHVGPLTRLGLGCIKHLST